MAIDENAIGVAAAPFMEEVSAAHAEHVDPAIRTLGIVVAVEYDDPETGERRTSTHYRFLDAPELEGCPAYVALGLATQVAQHMAS